MAAPTQPSRALGVALVAIAAASMAGCTHTIKLEAPDKPIAINLDVNIKQEVIVRLDREVQDLIKQNPAIF